MALMGPIYSNTQEHKQKLPETLNAIAADLARSGSIEDAFERLFAVNPVCEDEDIYRIWERFFLKIGRIFEKNDVLNGNGMEKSSVRLDSSNSINSGSDLNGSADKNKVPKKVSIFIPGKDFPSISVTGAECALNCEHCNKKYLKHMLPATSNDGLYDLLVSLAQKGANGALLSGGCTPDGVVPILRYRDAIIRFKNKHPNFMLNSHVGLLSDDEISLLAETPVDYVSFDLVLDDSTIRDVFHLNKSAELYKHVFESMLEKKIPVVPHILIGSYFGKIHKEKEIVNYLSEILSEFQNVFKELVFIAMIPPPGRDTVDTDLSEGAIPSAKNGDGMKIKFHRLNAVEINRVILYARYYLQSIAPNLEFSLGCMRPKNNAMDRFYTELFSYYLGVNRIVLPSSKFLRFLKRNGDDITVYHACCVI